VFEFELVEVDESLSLAELALSELEPDELFELEGGGGGGLGPRGPPGGGGGGRLPVLVESESELDELSESELDALFALDGGGGGGPPGPPGPPGGGGGGGAAIRPVVANTKNATVTNAIIVRVRPLILPTPFRRGSLPSKRHTTTYKSRARNR